MTSLLYVDNNAKACIMVAHALGTSNVDVTTITCIKDARALLRSKAFQSVIVNLELGDCVKQLGAELDAQGISCIFLSSMNEVDSVRVFGDIVRGRVLRKREHIRMDLLTRVLDSASQNHMQALAKEDRDGSQTQFKTSRQ